jgi:hypothetical protein
MLSFEGESHVGVIFICFKENLRLWYFPHWWCFQIDIVFKFDFGVVRLLVAI